jgi:hypothetical protein
MVIKLIKVDESTQEQLEKLKLHPRQSYDEVIVALLKAELDNRKIKNYSLRRYFNV